MEVGERDRALERKTRIRVVDYSMMDEGFEIPVTYAGNELRFPAQLLAYGYSYKIEVDVNGTKVFFEPDEERNWRALIAYEEIQTNKGLSKELLQTIARAIEQIVK